MKSEQLIAKKVKHHFSAAEKQVLFDVKSLEEHYDGLLIHESDIIYLEEEDSKIGYVKVGDVNMDDAVSKEFVETLKPVKEEVFPVWVNPVLEIKVDAETLKDNPELKAEGIVVGKIVIDDAVDPIEEIVSAKVVKKKRTKK